MADGIAIGLRALAYAAALLAAGVPIFIWIFGSDLARSARRIRAMPLPAALTGLTFTIAHAIVEPARLTGELSGILDGSLQTMLLGSDFGTTIAVRTLGLLIIVGGWLKPSRAGEGAALIGTSLIVVSFAFMGHTAADSQRWLLAPLLIAHLFTVAFWFGSLWPLVTVARLENAAIAGAVIERFSKVAIWAVSVIFIAGIAMAGALLQGLASLRSPYGMSLIGKLSGFAILMALAAMNKWRLGPKIALGNSSSLRCLQISVLAEWALILTVVTITAAMTALFSPDH